MWIVALALRRPYTFVVMSLLIIILGAVTVRRMPVDIFPAIDIPVIAIVWTYGGLPAEEMEGRVVTVIERALTTTVSDIEHIESQSMRGVSVIKVFFREGADINAAQAQVTAISQTLLRPLPPGITPPLIIRYSATTVPVLQATVSSETLPEDQINDLGGNFLRTQLATVQGASVLPPLGGRPRQIMVDINPELLHARGLSAVDVSNALNAQNLILPAGTAKIGNREYDVRLNSSPDVVEAFNDLPIRAVNGAMVYMRDVAQVRDGGASQQAIVRQDGRRGALMPIYKSGSASTLDIVARVREAMPRIQAGLPEAFDVKLLFDQSVFVRAAVEGVLLEAGTAACLTGAMILLFLGSWRSTLIVTISIPLSIMCSIIGLGALGYTLNVMTLGGLALAVGILVDDATVEIENIHRNLAMGKPLKRAILDGAQQVATPAFVATLSICIVFVPVTLITGTAGFLFTPMALAVVFAMLASYLLSRTLIPTLVMYLLKAEVDLYREHSEEDTSLEKKIKAVTNTRATALSATAPAESVSKSQCKSPGEEQAVPTGKAALGYVSGAIWRVHEAFNRRFERLRGGYLNRLRWALAHRAVVAVAVAVIVVCSCALIPFIGQDFFPQTDAGQIKLHMRAPTGTRLEETERIAGQVEQYIREIIPPAEIETILDTIGLVPFGLAVAYSDGATIGTGDAEILVALKEGAHEPTDEYVKRLRADLPGRFPECTFFFQPADIVTQILNFGLPAAIDIQVSGPSRNREANYEVAREIAARVRGVPGAADVRLHQVVDSPVLRVNVDRTRAEQVGLTQQDVARNMLLSLSGSGQIAPNFFLSPNGVSYQVVVQTPEYRNDSLDALLSTPVAAPGGTAAVVPQQLNNLATVTRETARAVSNHYDVQPVFDIYANTQDRDLGGVASDIDVILAEFREKLPRGSSIVLRGQVASMRSSFLSLGLGLVFAVALVYLLMTVNFQSWTDPLIILMALPGALSGILWMLFVTQTTFSVPALMGAVMCVGVATANSILLVTFANDQRAEGKDAMQAALEAGYTRLRPVLMTALAMIIGMLPMSLGFGEGGEQNAPLGRAVIGGLIVATLTTIFFVPIAYSRLRQSPPNRQLDDDEDVVNDRMPTTAAGERKVVAA